jgi:hypothetical protein
VNFAAIVAAAVSELTRQQGARRRAVTVEHDFAVTFRGKRAHDEEAIP